MNKINGIDVSESVSSATNNNIYYSQKAVDELLNDIKRLQEENEGLKSLNDFNVQKIEVLQKENEELKARLKTLDDEVLTIEITPDEFERYKKYEQALEEIRNKIGDLKNINRLINLQKILDTIDEVLDD